MRLFQGTQAKLIDQPQLQINCNLQDIFQNRFASKNMDLFSKFFAQISSNFGEKNGPKNTKLIRRDFWHVFDQMSKISLNVDLKRPIMLQHFLAAELGLEKRKTLYHTWDWSVLQGPVLLDGFQLTF